MRVSSAAICTLAALAAWNATQQAIALESPQTPIQEAKNGDLVVPVTTNTPAQVENVASPETVVAQQFSQDTTNDGQYNQDYQNTTVVPTVEPAAVPTPETRVTPAPIQQAQAQPTRTPTNNRPATPTTPARTNDLVVTATDVQVVGATEELHKIARDVIKTRAGGETSQSKLQQDVSAILDTGLFADVRVNTFTNNAGLRVVYEVQPVVVRSLQLQGAKALTLQVALEPFQSQLGKTISPAGLNQAVQQINKWYADNGYSLARVVSIRPNSNGALVLNVAEGVVSNIKFRFLNEEGKTVDSNAKPVDGRTQEDFLRREVKLKPGQLFREELVRQDLQQLYRLGLFEDVKVSLEGDASQVDVIYELQEAPARAVNVGGSYSADRGLTGTISYRDQNVGGISDSLGVQLEVSRRDLQFEGNFNSPYRASNPDRFGYNAEAFRRRGISETFDDDIKLANGDRAREGQFGGGIALQRPIEGWNTSLGLNYTRTSIRDGDGEITPTDAQGNPLSFSGTGIDDLTTVSFTAVRDERDNPVNPTQGSVISLSTEQSIPIGLGNISMNRLRANYTQYLPVRLFGDKNPDVFAVNLQGGTVIGDLPPYEAFNLGGPNSVRGYESGDVGSGRSYVLASAEYRFPIFKPVGGVLFADFASDLGSGDTVLGEPAVVRGKPGTGFGYGAGVRIQSPLGLIRADYGINDEGESRLHFGIGQRF